MARRHQSSDSQDITTKNRTGTSFNLSPSETDRKFRNTSVSKIPEERSVNKNTVTSRESEQLEFNVYEYTKRKDAKPDFNNTKDTAEFGDCDMQISKESQEVRLSWFMFI